MTDRSELAERLARVFFPDATTHPERDLIVELVNYADRQSDLCRQLGQANEKLADAVKLMLMHSCVHDTEARAALREHEAVAARAGAGWWL